METIKAINEWSFQVMFLVMSVAGMTWCVVGMVEAVKYAAKEWFKSSNRPGTKPGSEALNSAKR